MNDKLPPKGTTELASLVGDGSDDLLVFGFQEAGTSPSSHELTTDVRHQALLFSQGNDRAAAWEEALFRGLGDRASEFEKVGTSLEAKLSLRPARFQSIRRSHDIRSGQKDVATNDQSGGDQ